MQADGLGDTVRVSLTEDPEFELKPCQTLIDIGTDLYDPARFEDIPDWKETQRDFADIVKRRGMSRSMSKSKIGVEGSFSLYWWCLMECRVLY